MDAFYDSCDNLIEDDLYASTVDTPSTAINGISDIYTNISSSLDTDAMLTAMASLSDTCCRISDSIQPVVSSFINAGAISESIVDSMNRLSEAIEPAITSCAMEGISAAMEQLQDSVAINTALESVSSIGGCLCDSFMVGPGITAALDTTFQSSLVESMQPLVASRALDEIVTTAQKNLDAFQIDEINEFCNELTTTQPAMVDIVPPIQSAFSAMSDTLTIHLDISKISAAISLAFDFKDMVSEMMDRLYGSMLELSEVMRSFCEDSFVSIHDFAHFVLHYIYSIWNRHPHRHMLPAEVAVMRAAAMVRIDLAPPLRIREFCVIIRQSFLQKHQRISDDSDDLDDSYLCTYATT